MERVQPDFKRISLPVLVIILLITAFSGISCGGPRSFDKETEEKLDAVVEGAISSGIPGVLAGIWIPDTGDYEAARGSSDNETGSRIQLTDKFRIGSITKGFTATLILQLVDDGRVELGESVDKYVQGVPNGSAITIRQLLNMTSGLYSFTEDEGFIISFNADPLMKMTNEEKLRIAYAHAPYFPPGEGFHYSDTNYVLLGMIVEKVTGSRLAEEIEKRIAEPLGLESTSLPPGPEMTGGYSHSYVYNKETGGTDDYTMVNPEIPWAGGGMVSNMADLKKWAKALATGELISEKMHKEQMKWMDVPGAEEMNMKYGLGLYNIDGFIGNSGSLFGYNCIAFYYPEEDGTFVVFTNLASETSLDAASVFITIVKTLYSGIFENL